MLIMSLCLLLSSLFKRQKPLRTSRLRPTWRSLRLAVGFPRPTSQNLRPSKSSYLTIGELTSAEKKALPKTEDAGKAAHEDKSDDNNEDNRPVLCIHVLSIFRALPSIGDHEKHDEEGEEIEVVEDERARRRITSLSSK